MAVLEWSADFSVGVEELDNQHKRIVSLINRLDEHFRSGLEMGVVSDILNELRQYGEAHLASEEKYLQERNYSDFANHKDLHKDYVERFAKLCLSVSMREPDWKYELVDFLTTWWVDHILEEDQAYARELGTAG